MFGFFKAIRVLPISFQQMKFYWKSWEAIKSIRYLSSKGMIEISKEEVNRAILLVVMEYSILAQKEPRQFIT